MEKDARRIFTQSQKREVLEAFRNQCQGLCCIDRDLSDKPVEFHHVSNHSTGGATERMNCIPLCVSCHREYTREQRSHEFGPLWVKLRHWQRDAIERYIDACQRLFVLEAATGSGKTLFAATAAHYEISKDAVDHIICIAPWTPIIRSLKKSFGVYGLECRDKFNYDSTRGVYQRRPHVAVTVDTYQGFCKHLSVELLKRWTSDSQNPFRFMLILDEVHHTNTVTGKWGPHIEAIAGLASKILVMSGTYFRTDNRPISFLEYEQDKPKTHYQIGYMECVKQRYTRQVSFRYHDPLLDVYSKANNSVYRRKLSRIPRSSSKMTNAAKAEVLDPSGQHATDMIREAWSELQAMRRKWSDAACLVICRAGKNGAEERAVHAVAQKIKEITGSTVESVTSDDAASRGRIEAFTNGSDPFLCAIRMVSEGVDIPRVRMILFLSYTDSEMLFRQIVGRCVRYIDGKEDDTAALVIMPKFPVMYEFSERFENEAKMGALDMEPIKEPGTGGTEPTAKICVACESDPCKCFVVLSSESLAGGGQIASSSVDERYIEIAKRIRDTSSAHQHSNPVQMADALQKADGFRSEPIKLDLSEAREMAWKNIERLVRTLARHVYNSEYGLAWSKEVHSVAGADAKEIKANWRIEQINELKDRLRARLQEALSNA